jgi:transposase
VIVLSSRSSGAAFAQGSAIADETIKRISQLYAVEKETRGSPPDLRADLRQAQAKPIFDDLEVWLHAQLPSISGKSPLAGAIRYALTRMARLRPYLEHGILELDNNTAERAMRSVAIVRRIADWRQGRRHRLYPD